MNIYVPAVGPEDLTIAQANVLKVLEEAIRRKKDRPRGDWIGYLELSGTIGPRYGARIFEMRKKGFLIAMDYQPQGSRKSWYRLEGYPETWKGPRVFGEVQGRLFQEIA